MKGSTMLLHFYQQLGGFPKSRFGRSGILEIILHSRDETI